jgi:ABC-type Fe3+/spermidine/putrescine transport system ATPase subunit
LLERLGIGHLAARRPGELSGGEQQRVGIARALARRATVNLFDEPTAHLDAALRAELRDEIRRLREHEAAAQLIATHDLEEAFTLADRVVLLRDGRVVQVGPPADVYAQPVDRWAARITGPANVLRGVVAEPSGGAVVLAGGIVPVSGLDAAPPALGVPVLVRPDWIELSGGAPGRVLEARYRGTHTDCEIETEAGPITVREPGPPRRAAGEPVRWRALRGHVLREDADGEALTGLRDVV